MIEEGYRSKARYWGEYEVKKVIKLNNPVVCNSDEVGEVEFNPTIVQIIWNKPPSNDKHELWFPYWIKINGREKYGQFAPMIGQQALLELLSKAIENDLFNRDFLSRLKTTIINKLERP